MIDPERAFVARLRETLTDVTVDVRLTVARPCVRVDLIPGGTTQVRRHIDRVRIDLVCYGADPRGLAGQTRAAVRDGFAAGGQQVFAVDADPPYPIPDAITYEIPFFVSCTASLHVLQP